MRRSRLSGIAALLVAMAAVAPAVAHAVEPRRVWWHKGAELTKGAPPLPVKIKGGSANVSLLSGPDAGVTISCKDVTGAEEVWNPAPDGFGEDNVSSLSFSKCKSSTGVCTLKAAALPWHSTLYRESAEVEGDAIEDIELEVTCGSEPSVLEGSPRGGVSHNHQFPQGLLTGPLGAEASAAMAWKLHVAHGGLSINA